MSDSNDPLLYAEKLPKQPGFCRPGSYWPDDSHNQKNSQSRYLRGSLRLPLRDIRPANTKSDIQLEEIRDDREKSWWYDSFQIAEEGWGSLIIWIWRGGSQRHSGAEGRKSGLYKQIEIFSAVDRFFRSYLCWSIYKREQIRSFLLDFDDKQYQKQFVEYPARIFIKCWSFGVGESSGYQFETFWISYSQDAVEIFSLLIWSCVWVYQLWQSGGVGTAISYYWGD